MDHPRMTLELRPLHQGAYTLIRLRGPVITTPSVRDVRRLLAVLAFWHGGSVHVVLSVAGTNADACWAELWDDVMRDVPAHHAEIRFEIRGITPAAPIGHER
jgi:hypothetical protein